MQPSQRFRPLVKRVCTLLPELVGDPITVELRAVSPKVHAATDIRKRVIALDPVLAVDPAELARILIHEVFHFVWVRLGNSRRDEYAELIAGEFKRGARGELGWSSESRKIALRGGTSLEFVHPKWREYICESFCDTAAWCYADLPEHDEFTLSARYRTARARWFAESFDDRRIFI